MMACEMFSMVTCSPKALIHELAPTQINRIAIKGELGYGLHATYTAR